MDNFKLLLWLRLLIWITEASVQRFAIEPQDQTVLVNSTAILPCRVSDKLGILQWTKDDLGLEIDSNWSVSERYSMIGNQTRGDYNLQIYPVMLEDDGKYQCQVSPATEFDEEILSNFATLTVMVPPEPPRIVQGSYLVAYEYLQTKLECLSYGGRPAPAINWFDNQGNRLTHGINSTGQVLPDGKRFLIKSVLTIIPRIEDRNTTFTCRTQNAAEPTYQSAVLTLEVRYPLHLTISVSSSSVLEGADVGLKYQAQVYIITELQFRNKPQSVLADFGDIVTLCCDVGSPLQEITWLFVNSSQIVGHDANLTFQVNLNNAGRYKCIVHVLGFTDIEAETTIFLKGVPNIISPQTQFGVEGDTVRVECTAHSIPTPTSILWSYDLMEVQGEEYSILEEPLPEGMTSTLIIRKSEKRHFGLYSCRVTNSYGSDVLEIDLKTEAKFSFMTVVNISMIAVVILAAVVLVIVIVWYRRLRRRALANVENQLREPNDTETTSFINLELGMNCTRSNQPKSETGNKSESRKTRTLPASHGSNRNDHTYDEIENWPPVRTRNYAELEDLW